MKEFEVICKSSVYVMAENLAEANRIMEDKYPELETLCFYDTEEKEEYEVIGHCEDSGLSIFEGDDYSYDFEGCMWLNNQEQQ
jgi:hypothetical protein